MMVETKEISELTRSNRIAMLSHISTVTAVSYTHLDVYKRQAKYMVLEIVYVIPLQFKQVTDS